MAGGHFSQRKWWWQPHYPTKSAASICYLVTLLVAVLTWSGYWIPLKLSFMLHVSSYVLRSYEFENAVLSLVMQGGSETSDSV